MLGLDPVEVLLTKSSIRSQAIWIALAMFAIVLSLIGGPRWVPIAGFSYALLGPAQAFNGSLASKAADRLRSSE